MSRPVTSADLLPGDTALLRADSIRALPPTDPVRIACEAILYGERFLDPLVLYFHACMITDVLSGAVLEELSQGQVEDHENILGPCYDIYRQDGLTAKQRADLVAANRSRIGQPYGWGNYLWIAGVRVFRLPLGHPAYTSPTDGSGTIAIAEADIHVYPWASRGIDPALVAPSDWPGDGMRLISQAGMFVGAGA